MCEGSERGGEIERCDEIWGKDKRLRRRDRRMIMKDGEIMEE